MSLPANPDHTSCRRCGASFTCKPQDISRCDCAVVPLNDGERRFIAASYRDCLCTSCLYELKQLYAAGKRQKAIFCWSGGKDSAMALHRIILENRYEVCYLLTTVHQTHRRISMHGVRESLLAQQAESLGFPLLKVEVVEGTNAEYERQMGAVLEKARSEGIEHVIFGDIFLEDLRAYREQNLARVGMTAVFPLWQNDTAQLLLNFSSNHFRTVLCCVNDAYLEESWLAREIDEDFRQQLPADVDPCGENGEYHTFCFDGPIFRKPVQFTRGEAVYRPLSLAPGEEPEGRITKGFWYIDLMPVDPVDVSKVNTLI